MEVNQDSEKREGAKISVLIPTFNEEKNIRDCIESVKWADEIVVVDSFSKDQTVKIAAEYTERILEHEYINSATQKNWAIPQLKHEWIMIVDADERVTPELRDEILDILANGTKYDGFYIYRINHFLGKRIKNCGWDRDKCLRLFRNGKGKYQDREVHADIILDGCVGYLKNKFLHYTFTSFDQYLKKWHRYTSWASNDRAKRTKKVRWYHLTCRPAWRFFKQYILKRGFLDGRELVILTNSFQKKTQKTPPKEIKLAERRKKDYLDRK